MLMTLASMFHILRLQVYTRYGLLLLTYLSTGVRTPIGPWKLSSNNQLLRYCFPVPCTFVAQCVVLGNSTLQRSLEALDTLSEQRSFLAAYAICIANIQEPLKRAFHTLCSTKPHFQVRLYVRDIQLGHTDMIMTISVR